MAQANLLNDERGSVLSEAVIVLPFFVLLLGFSLYVAQRYHVNLRSLHNNQQAVWYQAIEPCAGSRDPFVQDLATAMRPSLSAWLPEYSQQIDFISRAYSYEEKSLELVRPDSLGGGRQTLKMQSELGCNAENRELISGLRDRTLRLYCNLGACL
ncbi:MAG: hypothetical protein IPJ88_06120 [Myxococcales bacterium]|nr:MAG: hypothetical protein IPJ88_06120 [Myxococcales bacterium]